MNTTIPATFFGYTPNGETVESYLLTNAHGLEVKLTNYGATVVSIKTPDRRGSFADIILGFDNLEGYLGDHPCFGSTVGRFANRIAKGQFSLNGEIYSLAINNGPNHLHGGLEGFHRKLWETKSTFSNDSGQGVVFSYISEDGEEGYPGKLEVRVTYTLTSNNELDIDYQATTDKSTVINLTNHMYFNLRDGGKTDVLNHHLMLNADFFTPSDENQIPTGEIDTVYGSPFYFRDYSRIGDKIDEDHIQINYGGGYDHNFIINQDPINPSLNLAASVKEPINGRMMEVYTTEPGIQLYTGNFLDGSITGKGISYQKRSGFCLETQHYPDSPNKPNFPSVSLHPGEIYTSKTRHTFSTY